MNIQEMHANVLYPLARVRAQKAGGSGIVIYSQPDPRNEGDHLTFLLTCQHVIDDSIVTKKEWDSVLKKNLDKEILTQVHVELFDYVRLSEVNSANVHRADIVAYDKPHDLAILKLESPKPYPYPAHLIPRDNIPKVKVFAPVFGCGCSLLHDPFPTSGRLSYLKEDIEGKIYWMNSANQIFGNSGGAVFLEETGELVGVTARVTVTQLGFSLDVQTWMNFCVSPTRIYQFFDEQELKFLYDPTDDYYRALERRKKKQEAAKYGKRGTDQAETEAED